MQYHFPALLCTRTCGVYDSYSKLAIKTGDRCWLYLKTVHPD